MDSGSSRQRLASGKRWVIKIGSALLTDNGRGVNRAAILNWAGQIAALRDRGIEVILVSSGAVAAGMDRLGWRRRPESIHQLQAAAAIGQSRLVQVYEHAFGQFDCRVAQILLDHDDLSDRTRYLNARSTLRTLLSLGAVPIVNENDTVTTDEIRFGDNDTLAALVANLVEANALLILTDADGLFSQDPRDNPQAELIGEASAADPKLLTMAGGARSGLGRGGMATKVRAAQLAARSGACTVIAGGARESVIERVCAGEPLGTMLTPESDPLTARKRWLAGQLQVRGALTLDSGAELALRTGGKSLLAVGVTAVEGRFHRGELVSCRNSAGEEIARGLVNYDSGEAAKILRQPSEKFVELLGYRDDDELIHRDNLILL
ncbi:glutamate 5-kinase [Microbulbifer thermotolerans]|uniref:Glutamate 5-kinase n=1 Tax=Microbulbifer thermotolerans TaxID=252514 RepID=A0A143HIT3_MICTH|nr:glutamate 5-kinase [Microbulbifer thermotolerans]AMX01629.1 glutamate 5-kinase [Microbulbifer thermotolerans]WKT61120.1 glutamate 5-kinase [Microbulbifer thermotolerans]